MWMDWSKNLDYDYIVYTHLRQSKDVVEAVFHIEERELIRTLLEIDICTKHRIQHCHIKHPSLVLFLSWEANSIGSLKVPL